MNEEKRAELKRIMDECPHDEKIAIPDSLATMCEKCGKVWVAGEPWDYKSGHVVEWAEDLVQTRRQTEQQERLIKILEVGKPQFPWATVIPALIGAAIGLSLIIWGISMVK